jgi:hypothetical protein
MKGWELAGYFALCGLAGGIARALLGGSGVVLPKTENGIWLPGFVGSVIAGPLAAVVSWALYGPFANALAIGSKTGAAKLEYTASFAELGGAFLVGFAGSQWLNSESDKRLSKAAAVEAAKKNPNVDLAGKIATSSPREALQAVRAVPDPD